MLKSKLTRRNFMERSTAMAAAFAAGTGFSLGSAQAARETSIEEFDDLSVPAAERDALRDAARADNVYSGPVDFTTGDY